MCKDQLTDIINMEHLERNTNKRIVIKDKVSFVVIQIIYNSVHDYDLCIFHLF